MIPALFTSSSALAASQTMLSVVGNNLANSNTAGYKAQTVTFSNQFSQLLSGSSGPSEDTGGRDPVQVGMGVKVASTSTNLTQGTYQTTGNPYDLAIQNAGYFVLKDGSQTVYTRSGSFNVDADGSLIDPATGAKVQRVGTVGEGTATDPAFQTAGDNNISIPAPTTIPGVPTQNVTFKGNLSANAAGPTTQVLTSGQAMTAGGLAATLTTSLDALDQTTKSALFPTGYQAGDTIQITGTRVDGTKVNATYSTTGVPANDTVGALLNSINQAFLSGTPSSGATATLDSTGRIVLTANQSGASHATLTLSASPNPSGTSTQFANFTQTTAGKAGDTATSVIQVYDSQGTAHNVTFTFQKVSANTWDITASINPNEGTIQGFGEDNTVAGVIFNADGSLQSVAGNSQSAMLVTHNPMTVSGTGATSTTTLESLDQHTPAGTPYAAGDSITITGTDFSGNAITPVVVPAYTAGVPATVGDIVNAINSAYGSAVASLDSSGNITLTASRTGQTPLSITIADTATNTGGSTAFSSFDIAKPGTDGDANIAFTINNLAGFGQVQNINLNLGTPNTTSGVSQTGSSTSVSATKQDGYAEGTLLSTSIGADGIITGQFSNGQSKQIAQIALATFTNPGGLENVGNNYFKYSTASGLPKVSTPTAGGAGSILSGGLEGSNVDVGTEFTRLIAAQRGYQVNAKAFSVANTMMQDSIDLIR